MAYMMILPGALSVVYSSSLRCIALQCTVLALLFWDRSEGNVSTVNVSAVEYSTVLDMAHL